MRKLRLDRLLADRCLFENRSRAAAAIMEGSVYVNGKRASKPGQMVTGGVAVDLDERPQFVSRGGRKLANALAELQISVNNKDCLDVGASTGGFTDCLLQNGARRVIALDVAYGELNWGLRTDQRVVVIERQNARALQPAMLPFKAELIVIDVSFISLKKILQPVLATAADSFQCLAMVKPQFEAGRQQVGKGGVVRNADLRRQILLDLGQYVLSIGMSVEAFCFSGLEGPAGNRESFMLIERHVTKQLDLEEAVLRAEPL